MMVSCFCFIFTKKGQFFKKSNIRLFPSRKYQSELIMYESSISDKEQIAQRKQNHVNLNLARPCLRRDDAYSFEIESIGSKLLNPHIGLKSLGNFRPMSLIRPLSLTICQ